MQQSENIIASFPPFSLIKIQSFQKHMYTFLQL